MNALSQIALRAGGATLAHPDASLLLLSNEFERDCTAVQTASAAISAVPDDAPKAQHDKAWAAMTRHQGRMHRVAQKIHKITPKTMEGAAAKAQVVLKEIEDFDSQNVDPGAKQAHRFLKEIGTFLSPVPGLAMGADAELIELCRQIDELEDKMASNNKFEVQNTKYVCPIQEDLTQRQQQLIHQVCNLNAGTIEGFRARARTIVKWAPDVADGDNEDHGCLEKMISALLQDLTTTPAPQPVNPDAQLIALCERFIALEAMIREIDAKSDEAFDASGAVGCDHEGEALVMPYLSTQKEILPAILSTRAVTCQGVTARARALAKAFPDFLTEDHGNWDHNLAAAVIRDLVGLSH